MADHVITISNSVNCFGHQPSTKWNAFQWGVGKWGEGNPEDLVTGPEHFWAETITMSQDLFKDTIKVTDNSIASTFEGVDERRTDGSIWTYLYPGGTNDGDERVSTTWTDASPSTAATWTEVNPTATTWS